ncbi:MAG: TetR/AcrR family transcriptional regulator [Asticcacaulis sp.]
MTEQTSLFSLGFMSQIAVKDRIIGTALGLFYAHGLRATGIDRIIRESGVAKASFYRHFPSKDLLIAEVLRHWHEADFAALRQAVEAVEPKLRPLEVFNVLSERAQAEGYRGCALNNAVAELADRSHAGFGFVIEARAEIRQWFEALLSDAGFADMAAELSQEWLLLYDGALTVALRQPAVGRVAYVTAERVLQQIQLKRLLSKSLVP